MSTYSYIIDLNERLESTCKLAREELVKAQELDMSYQNRKASDRTFKVGDKMLLLLPTDHNKLLMNWKGPCKVVECPSALNYVIEVRGKMK